MPPDLGVTLLGVKRQSSARRGAGIGLLAAVVTLSNTASFGKRANEAFASSSGATRRLSRYADGKLLVLLSPAIILLAASGGVALVAQRRGAIRILGTVALAALVGGVLGFAALSRP